MTDEDAGPCGWGAPCEAEPDSTIQIRGKHGLGGAARAYLFGAWAVHRSVMVDDKVCDPDSWAVSHVPTGLSIGLALELGFWDAVRIARALDDTGVFTGKDFDEYDDAFIFESAIGAALHDHYVWPMAGAAP